MISFDVAGLKKEKEKKWDVGVTGSHFRESLLQGLTVKVSQPERGNPQSQVQTNQNAQHFIWYKKFKSIKNLTLKIFKSSVRI